MSYKTQRGNAAKKSPRFHAMIKKISDYQQVTYHPVAQKWQFLCKIHDIFKKKNVLVLLQRISYFDNCILTSLNRIANSSYCVHSLLNTSIIRAQTAFCTLLIEALGFYCLGVMLLLGFRVRTIFTSFSETSFFFAVKCLYTGTTINANVMRSIAFGDNVLRNFAFALANCEEELCGAISSNSRFLDVTSHPIQTY